MTLSLGRQKVATHTKVLKAKLEDLQQKIKANTTTNTNKQHFSHGLEETIQVQDVNVS